MRRDDFVLRRTSAATANIDRDATRIGSAATPPATQRR